MGDAFEPEPRGDVRWLRCDGLVSQSWLLKTTFAAPCCFSADYRYAIGQQAWSTCPMGDMEPGNDRGQLLLDTITPRYLTAGSDLGVTEMLELF